MDIKQTTNGVFQFKGEDHTLGNAARYMLCKNPDVEFAGYTIPHPSEPHMNIRVQTNGSKPAVESFSDSLHMLVKAYDHIDHAWEDAVAKAEAENKSK